MRRFPERLVRLMRAEEPQYTTHAAKNRDRLGLRDHDIPVIAKLAEWWQPNADEAIPGGYKYEMVGRDTLGRRLYTAGKGMARHGKTYWLVITLHEAK